MERPISDHLAGWQTTIGQLVSFERIVREAGVDLSALQRRTDPLGASGVYDGQALDHHFGRASKSETNESYALECKHARFDWGIYASNMRETYGLRYLDFSITLGLTDIRSTAAYMKLAYHAFDPNKTSFVVTGFINAIPSVLDDLVSDELKRIQTAQLDQFRAVKLMRLMASEFARYQTIKRQWSTPPAPEVAAKTDDV